MKDYKQIRAWGKYVSNREITNLPETQVGYLVPPSQDVYISDEGLIKSREGMSKYVNSQVGDDVFLAYQWSLHTGLSHKLAIAISGIYLLDRNDNWFNLTEHQNITFDEKIFSYGLWWDNNERREIMLFVKKDDSVYNWNGTFTYVKNDVNNTNQIEIEDDTHRQNIRVNDVLLVGNSTNGFTEVTVQSIVNSTTIQVSANVTLQAGDIVYSKIQSKNQFSYTLITGGTPTDQTNRNLVTDFNFYLTTIKIVNNKVYYGSLTSRRVFISKIDDYTDFRFGSPRTQADGDTFVLDAPVTVFFNDASQGRVIASCGKDRTYEIKEKELSLSNNVTYVTTIRSLKSGSSSAAFSERASTEVKYSIAFLTHDKTIDTAGRLEQLETPNAKPLSFDIEPDLEAVNPDDAYMIYYKNKLFTGFPKSSKVFEFDFSQQIWQAPYNMYITAMAVYDGELIGFGQNGQAYKLFDGLDDDGEPINAIMALNYRTFGERFLLKQFDILGLEGYVNETGEVGLEIIYDYQGMGGSSEYKSSDNSNDMSYIVSNSIQGLGMFGTSRFGSTLFGAGLPTSSGIQMRKFRWFISTTPNDFFEIQLRIKAINSTDTRSRIALVAYGMNARLSKNNAKHYSTKYINKL